MNISIKTRLSILLLTLFIFIFTISGFFMYQRFQVNLAESLNNQRVWLQTYSQTFLDDIKMGRTASVKRKINFLVTKNIFDSITISLGDTTKISTQEKDVGKEEYSLLSAIVPRDSLKISLELVDNSNTNWGSIDGVISKEFYQTAIYEDLVRYIVYFIGLLFIYLGIILISINRIVSPILELTNKVANKIGSELAINEKNEILMLSKAFDLYDNQITKARHELAQKSKQEGIALVAAQVAHDVQSPLSSLRRISETLVKIPESQRIMLRQAVTRIQDIANHLITTHQNLKNTTTDEKIIATEQTSTQLLSSLINLIITEKRMQFRDKIGIVIDGNFSSAYGVFADVQPSEFKRVLSNLINNGVESLQNFTGSVQVNLYVESSSAIIEVVDTGCGISEQYLSKVCEQGASFGKKNGMGLGLYHAKVATENWGGSLRLESAVSVGTKVFIRLPLAEPPKWFLSHIQLVKKQTVVVIDDDASIHQVWLDRLRELKAKKFGIRTLFFTSLVDARQWYLDKGKHISSILFLCDYEFLGQDGNGLDLIEELGIHSKTVLVTSRHETPFIREKCVSLDLCLLPKEMAPFVPIEMKAEIEMVKDVILIDDDSLVRTLWDLTAREQGIKLQSFASPSEFFQVVAATPKSSDIYIDSNLGETIKGIDVAYKLKELGFTNLHLQTGYLDSDTKDLSLFKSVIGKDPPWVSRNESL